MKLKNKILIAASVFAASVALAALPTYKTFSAAGNNTTPAQIVLPADPNSQIRLVSIWYQSDTNKGVLQFSTAINAYYQTATNAATSSVTNDVSSTNGLVAGNIMVLQQGGNDYVATLSSFSSNSAEGRFIVLGSGGWGVAANAGADVYQMGSISTIPVGANTNALNGDAIFVGAYGRPVVLTLTPASATNQLPAVTVHYDSASQ